MAQKRSFYTQLMDQVHAVQPVTTVSLSGKVVVVIGANTGIGFETVKHFAAMNPAKIILGCRNEERGAAALEKLKESTGYTGGEMWLIDLNSFASVKAFAEKFEQEVDRLDILVANAAVHVFQYGVTEDGWETSLQVNYLGHCLLILRLLPIMTRTAAQSSVSPRVVIVSSGLHQQAKLPDKISKASSILRAMSSEENCVPYDEPNEYAVSKLLNLLSAIALTRALPTSGQSVIVNVVDPGFCYSELRRAEEGARQLIWASVANQENEDVMRGAYVSAMKIVTPSCFVMSEEGQAFMERRETVTVLSEADPKVRLAAEQCFVTSA
ncbi:hypothetical protein ONZ45_g14773 [Pleurotus djamor]|nr:hypothetical protein ONZ45_g14773 [Pleurotus djamor]